MPRKPIRTFDDFAEECKKLPTLEPREFKVTDPLERFFFDAAEKHGVVDAMLDEDSELEDG